MDERGRLPGATALAAWVPSAFCGDHEKSVSWLLRSMPPTTRPEPKNDSMVVVIDTALPWRSTTTKWLVPPGSRVASAAASGRPDGWPCTGACAAARGPIRARRLAT